jgi:aryl carrier-like protein
VLTDEHIRKSEEKLLLLWKEILTTEDVTVDSNFFDAGGDSLQMMTLLFRVSQEMGVELDPAAVFENPTIKELALLIAREQLQEEHTV